MGASHSRRYSLLVWGNRHRALSSQKRAPAAPAEARALGSGTDGLGHSRKAGVGHSSQAPKRNGLSFEVASGPLIEWPLVSCPVADRAVLDDSAIGLPALGDFLPRWA
jgi:hypothetical protein